MPPTAATQAGKEGKGKKAAAKKRGPVDPALLEQIFPVLTVEQEVPSVLRMRQMQQVYHARHRGRAWWLWLVLWFQFLPFLPIPAIWFPVHGVVEASLSPA